MTVNNFEESFYKKYLPEWTEIHLAIHKHMASIVNKTILFLFFAVIIPSFFYYTSLWVKVKIPFFVVEIYLYITFFKIIYDILNWYNDVWIITDHALVQLTWSLFKYSTFSVHYSDIKWLEIQKDSFIDSFLGQRDIVLHTEWEDTLQIKNATDTKLAYDLINQHMAWIDSQDVDDEEIIEEEKVQNFDTVMDVLSSVVEDYLWKNGYKKDDSSHREDYIEEIKSIDWTLDLRD